MQQDVRQLFAAFAGRDGPLRPLRQPERRREGLPRSQSSQQQLLPAVPHRAAPTAPAHDERLSAAAASSRLSVLSVDDGAATLTVDGGSFEVARPPWLVR